jgi:hypothetical protein
MDDYYLLGNIYITPNYSGKISLKNGNFCGKGIDKVGVMCNIMVKSGKKW